MQCQQRPERAFGLVPGLSLLSHHHQKPPGSLLAQEGEEEGCGQNSR